MLAGRAAKLKRRAQLTARGVSDADLKEELTSSLLSASTVGADFMRPADLAKGTRCCPRRDAATEMSGTGRDVVLSGGRTLRARLCWFPSIRWSAPACGVVSAAASRSDVFIIGADSRAGPFSKRYPVVPYHIY